MGTAIEIITIGVAVLSVVVNVVFSLIMARKNKYTDITVQQRIENLHFTRELTEKLIYMSSHEYIANSDKKELACRFVEVRDKLSYYYMRPFREEREIVTHISAFSDAWFAYVNKQTPENLNTLHFSRDSLFALTKINEIAYWRFIRDHYKLTVRTAKQFDEVYAKTRREFVKGGFAVTDTEEKSESK